MEENNKIYTPIELFGVECGKGWYPLIEPIIEYIDNYNKDLPKDEHIVILQIKEKWGVLQIYTNYHTDELYEMINKAEDASWNICESCGSEKYVGNTDHYISVCCVDCLEKMIAKRQIWFGNWIHHLTNKKYSLNTDSISEIVNEVKKAENNLVNKK